VWSKERSQHWIQRSLMQLHRSGISDPSSPGIMRKWGMENDTRTTSKMPNFSYILECQCTAYYAIYCITHFKTYGKYAVCNNIHCQTTFSAGLVS